MRMFKPVLGLLILSGVVGAMLETASAQGFGIPRPAPGSTTGIPLTVTGRIVKENGDPLPGVQMAGSLQTETMGGMGAGVPLPVVKPFVGIPKACFTDGATVTTDANGRYTYRTTFLPDAQINIRGDRCSTLRDRLTPANAAVVPSLSQPLMQQYNFEKATGPLPNNLPTVNSNVKAAPKAPPIGGALPQLK
jgi:hypothetical protein